ncbi:MAG TPA: hypothetical protein VGH93_00785 [Solirubrobacteraceae bacterium]|jgi:hypothetical protein
MSAQRPSRFAFWPELTVAGIWLTLFLLSDLVFRDDESLPHRATHIGLWLSAAWYVVVAVQEHRATSH